MTQTGFVLWFTGDASNSNLTEIVDAVQSHLRTRGLEALTARNEGGSDAHLLNLMGQQLAPNKALEVISDASPGAELREEMCRRASALVEVQFNAEGGARRQEEVEAQGHAFTLPLASGTVEESAGRIMRELEELNLIAAARTESTGYSQDDEEDIRRRLEDLGYL
jgi:hypothetical protein